MASKKQPQVSTFRWFLGGVLQIINRHCGKAIWAGAVIWLGHDFDQVLIAYAGQISIAKIAVEIGSNLNVTVSISLAVAGGATLGWLNEIRRHRNTRKRLTGRSQDLEMRLDKGRESSLLTNRGTTQEGDE